VLLGFTNFYRRFIREYTKVKTTISDLPKKSTSTSEWTRKAELSFWKLKKAFTAAPIHQHINPATPIVLQTDASGISIAGILNHYDGFSFLRPVIFYSRKCSPAEHNCNTYNRELLAIVGSLRPG